MEGNPADAEDLLVQQAIAESLSGPATDANLGEEDAELQRALMESVTTQENLGLRPLMGPEGPFLPAGLLNSGNSCFWNALVQALFFATPIFRGALFQLDLAGDGGTSSVLKALRDLFAEMDMGLASAIDAGKLYRMIFHQAEEADVSEQMHHLFQIASRGPSSLKAVWRELFSGDLFETLKNGESRREPLDLCQLDLCVTKPMSLPELLEEHAQDVQGSIQQRSYRLPPVLWLNLDRFAYDRVAKCGKKRQVKVTFPERLNTWMLVPLEAKWAQRLRTCVDSRRSIVQELAVNRQFLQTTAEASHTSHKPMTELEQDMLTIAEQQEALMERLAEVEQHMEQLGEEQELMYELRAVIVHRGVVDHGHYFAYVRSPSGSSKPWCCLNDANVSLCEEGEMRRMAEGTTFEDGGDDAEVEAEEMVVEDSSVEQKEEMVKCSEIPTLTSHLERAEAPSQGLWHWLSTSFGCIPASTSRFNSEEGFPAPADAEVSSTPVGSGAGSPFGQPVLDSKKSPGRSPVSPASLNLGRSSTEARCLVYVRRGGPGCEKLLDEVRQRIPGALQEQIDVCNHEALRKAIEHVVSDVTLCSRHLQAGSKDDREDLQGILRTAEWVRSEAGMSMTRAYLLRACWRLHIPWLPEELCPTALPPDFRMHYGRTARQLLLDALIRQGQHDVASLAASGDDAFAPLEMQDWLKERGL